VFVVQIFDLLNQLTHKRAVIDRLGVQALVFTSFDLVQIISVQAHDFPDTLRVRNSLNTGTQVCLAGRVKLAVCNGIPKRHPMQVFQQWHDAPRMIFLLGFAESRADVTA
jgi:hypothetical protein